MKNLFVLINCQVNPNLQTTHPEGRGWIQTIVLKIFCRVDRIRTCDILVPNQVHYRTVLLPYVLWARRDLNPHSLVYETTSSTT